MPRAAMSSSQLAATLHAWMEARRKCIDLNLTSGIQPGTVQFKELSEQTLVELRRQSCSIKGLDEHRAGASIELSLITQLEAEHRSVN